MGYRSFTILKKILLTCLAIYVGAVVLSHIQYGEKSSDDPNVSRIIVRGIPNTPYGGGINLGGTRVKTNHNLHHQGTLSSSGERAHELPEKTNNITEEQRYGADTNSKYLQSSNFIRQNDLVISKQWLDEMNIKQRDRIEHKRIVCNNGLATPPSALHYQPINPPRSTFDLSYSNDDYKFLISTVWKAGSIHWKKVLQQLHDTGSIDFRKRQPDPVKSMEEMTDLYIKLKEYYKIIFVRHPFSRLLSAWRDKIFEVDKLDDSPYYRNKARRIVKMYRPGANKSEIIAGNATFLEFATWVASGVDHDFHWNPISWKYRLCQISYDFIGKIETADNDTAYLFKLLQIDQLVSYPISYNHAMSGDYNLLRHYYGGLPSDLIDKLIRKFEADFTIFGYQMPGNKSDFLTGIDLIGI